MADILALHSVGNHHAASTMRRAASTRGDSTRSKTWYARPPMKNAATP